MNLDADHPSTCEGLANLTYHMLTRFPRIVEEHEASEQVILIRTTSISIPIGGNQQFSSSFFDFLEKCMDDSSNLADIANVSATIWSMEHGDNLGVVAYVFEEWTGI
jgi:hypothetical protein